MSQQLTTAVAVVGIDIGKNSFHVVGLDERGAIVLRYQGDDVADRSFTTCPASTVAFVRPHLPESRHDFAPFWRARMTVILSNRKSTTMLDNENYLPARNRTPWNKAK